MDTNLTSASYVVTLGRTFGSGGREIGERLARRLGIGYYDRRLLQDAARQADMAPEFFEKCDERFPRYISSAMSMAHGFSAAMWLSPSNAISDDSVYRAQAEFMRQRAAEGPCLLVGRTADYVLRDHPGLVSLFVSAPEQACVRRILSRGDAPSAEAAVAMLRRANKLRAAYYNFYSDKTWGAAGSYDLCVDSSTMPMDALVDLLAGYVRARVENMAGSQK